MKLILSIVHSDDVDPLVTALREHGFRSTMISTTGGFLRRGNATLLIGTEDAKVDQALEIIRGTCHPHTEASVPISGATVFVFDLARHEKF